LATGRQGPAMQDLAHHDSPWEPPKPIRSAAWPTQAPLDTRSKPNVPFIFAQHTTNAALQSSRWTNTLRDSFPTRPGARGIKSARSDLPTDSARRNVSPSAVREGSSWKQSRSPKIAPSGTPKAQARPKWQVAAYTGGDIGKVHSSMRDKVIQNTRSEGDRGVA